MKINYINGNLITLAKQGAFDVIIQGCNCFCVQGAGLALQMRQEFDTLNPEKYPLEDPVYRGDINKLGQIDFNYWPELAPNALIVVNCYTQYVANYDAKPFDYDAFTLCMRKLNKKFKGKHIGSPRIGTHLAGGTWDLIGPIMERELKDCTVTVVDYIN